jgi:hypothetical protein
MRKPCEGLMDRVGVQSKWARRAVFLRRHPSLALVYGRYVTAVAVR